MSSPVVTQNTPGSVFDHKMQQWYLPAGGPPTITPRDASARLSKLADAVSIASVLFILGTLIGGIVLACTSGKDPLTEDPNHPHVLAGIGVVGVGLYAGLVTLMLASWARTYALGLNRSHSEPS